MGYSTYFSGRIELDKPLTASDITTIETLCDYTAVLPKEAPSTPCVWRVSPDGRFLESLNEEKMYSWDAWLQYLLDKVIAPAGIKANGRVIWQGEDTGDSGTIFVKDNRVKLVHIEDTPEPDWDEEGLFAFPKDGA